MNSFRSVLLRGRPPWRPRVFHDPASLTATAIRARSSVTRAKRRKIDSLIHIPVMNEEVLDLWLNDKWDDSRPIHLVDGTIGLGGHTLAAINSTKQKPTHLPDGTMIAPTWHRARVLGIDRDPVAVAKSRRRIEGEINPADDDREAGRAESILKLHLGSFADLSPGLLGLYSFPLKVDGILIDCGMNSFQIESRDRGFTFRQNGPLDMRYDMTTQSHKILEGQRHKKIPGKALKAWDIVNTYSESELASIFREFADEPYADEIARGIVEWRSSDQKREQKVPVGIKTTLELRYVIEDAVTSIHMAQGIRAKEHFPPTKFYAMWRAPTKRLPKKTKDKLLKKYAERKPRHANHVMRVFQALRMEVNDELLHIQAFFDRGIARHCLEVGGRLVMMAFHPGEDRIIKEGMEEMVKTGEFEMLTPEEEGLRPTVEEVKENPKARSARLRAVERVR